VSGNADLQPTWPPLLKIEKEVMKFEFFSYETTGLIGFKLG
jgi:hypothetical protein